MEFDSAMIEPALGPHGEMDTEWTVSGLILMLQANLAKRTAPTVRG